MKKIIFISFFILLIAFPVKASAADYRQYVTDMTEEYVDIDIENITLDEVIDFIIDSIRDKGKLPLQLTVRRICIVLIYSIVQAVSTENLQAIAVFDNVCTVTVFILFLQPMKEILVAVGENLYAVKNFMISFLPVYAGISLASGEVFASSVYTGFLLTAMVFISDFSLNIILPSVKVFFSLIITNAVSPYIKLKSLSDFYIKLVNMAMRISVSVICFVLTVQSAITRGKDTLAVKAGKILAGSAIPVIGSTLQEAVSSVYAGMETIKGFAGASGLIVIAVIFIPTLISLAVYWLCTNVIYIFGDLTDAKAISACVSGFIDIINLMVSIVVLYMVMLIFSLTIMIAVTNGV